MFFIKTISIYLVLNYFNRILGFFNHIKIILQKIILNHPIYSKQSLLDNFYKELFNLLFAISIFNIIFL